MFSVQIADQYFRVKDLEKQVSELESESERLSQALDAQGVSMSELEAVLKKRSDESARDIDSKVCY